MPILNINNHEVELETSTTIQEWINTLKADRETAKKLGLSKILDQVVVAELNGILCDLSTILDTDGRLSLFSINSTEGLDTMRHSGAHIMAQAVQRLFPGTRFGIGPIIKNGFYYDMDISGTLKEEDLPRIEAEMEKIVKENIPIIRKEVSIEQAMSIFKGDPYKEELIRDIPEGKLTVYEQGDFHDLCRGPHIPSTKWLKAFKLISTAGAYWRGSEKNKMLTRVYAVAFSDKKELKRHLSLLEEAKKRDHRKIGKELGLFSFHEQGPGLPFWKPKGLLLKNKLIEFMRLLHAERGYVEIETPTMLRDELWKTSGHWDNYKENMFFLQKDDESYAVKPMNCPGGMLVYKEDLHSYKELPLKVAEFGKVHRFERSGQLQGLFRVRGFTQDDAHIFTDPAHLQESVLETIQLVDVLYTSFGFKYSVELSTRPEKSIGSEEQWEIATNGLRDALETSGLEYKINEGDGAFYGPKIDFHLQDAIGRTHQCGTIQLDMNLTERFNLNYVGEDGHEHRVIMLHRAIYGSLERFVGILIEHFAGRFPAWLSPVQVKVLTVTDAFVEYGQEVKKQMTAAGLRVEGDFTSEKLGYKIRKAQKEKVPYMLVIGEKEANSQSVAVRSRDGGDQGAVKTQEFIATILEEIENKR